MPIDTRDWYRDKHPPHCTCAKCTERRLAAIKSKRSEVSEESSSRGRVESRPKQDVESRQEPIGRPWFGNEYYDAKSKR